MKTRINGWFFVLILSVQALIAITFEKTWTLKRCIDYARESNPRILSVRHLVDAGRARIRQAAALPQPSLDLDFDLQPQFFNIKDAGETYVGISQDLEFPAKILCQKRIAERESRELAADVDTVVLDTVFKVKEAFYLLLQAQERSRLQRENLDLAKEFLDKTRVKFEAGDVARVEVMRAQVEVARAMAELKRALDDEAVARSQLNYVLGRREGEALVVSGDFIRSPLEGMLENMLVAALSARPELARLQASLEREKLKIQLGKLSYLPDFNIGVSRHRIASEPATWDIRLSISVPLYVWQPAAKIAEARAGYHSLQMEQRSQEDSVRLEVDEAFRRAASASQQIELFENDILKQAQEIYHLFLESYQTGQIGGIDLIEARRSLNEAQVAYIDALCQYSVTRSALERATGQSN